MLQKSFRLLTPNLIYVILRTFSGEERQTVKYSNPKQTPVHCALLHGGKTPPTVRKSRALKGTGGPILKGHGRRKLWLFACSPSLSQASSFMTQRHPLAAIRTEPLGFQGLLKVSRNVQPCRMHSSHILGFPISRMTLLRLAGWQPISFCNKFSFNTHRFILDVLFL